MQVLAVVERLLWAWPVAPPSLRLETRLAGKSPSWQGRVGGDNVLQGGAAGQPGVVVGGGVGADVVVLLGDIMVPACIFTQNGTCLVDTNI